MTANKTIIIFANSRKNGGHCVAGKCLATGNWVRPVANAQGGALAQWQTRYANQYGTFESVKPLQKIRMKLTKHVPLPHQSENHLISGDLWEQEYKISPAAIKNHLDSPESIWGSSDRVSTQAIQQWRSQNHGSLLLVEVADLSFTSNDARGRAKFRYRGLNYDLAVTDNAFSEFAGKHYSSGVALCISLGEEFHQNHFKLVAGIHLLQ